MYHTTFQEVSFKAINLVIARMGKIVKLVYFLDNTGDKGVDENTPIIPVQEHFWSYLRKAFLVNLSRFIVAMSY